MKKPMDMYSNIFPHFVYVAHRKCLPNWQLIGEPIHDKHNLVLVYEGSANITCNETSFNVSSGDLIYFKPGDYRLGHTFKNNLMRCYTVDFLYTIPTLKDDQWVLDFIELPFKSHEKINDQFLYNRLLELFAEFTKLYLGKNKINNHKARIVFMEILDLLFKWKSGNFNYDHSKKVDEIIKYMSENYRSPLTLEDFASEVGLSPSYLGKVFKSTTGSSPINYLQKIRIHKAKELLMDGHNISDIYEKVGFNDLFYFSKCFKKIEGICPSKYKHL